MYKNILLGIIVVLFFIISAVTTYTLSLQKNNPLSKALVNKFSGVLHPDVYQPHLPTLPMIFADDHSWTATLSAERKRIIVTTGDVIPARSVNNVLVEKNNFVWPYEKVKTTITSLNPDILFIDLETPLFDNCPRTTEGMIFCGEDTNIEGLQFLGVTVANLANNHIGNYGEEGVRRTRELLEKNNISYTGVSGALYQTVRGITFAFLGYNDIGTQPGIQNTRDASIADDIRLAKQQADVVIVQYHWGTEYQSQPDDRQIELAHMTIDAGADVIMSNHPHWIQPVELYNGKLIMYAHGNFVFDQMWSEETKKGVVGKYTFYDNQLIDVEFHPIYITDYGQPSFLEGEEKQKILSSLFEASKKRNNF